MGIQAAGTAKPAFILLDYFHIRTAAMLADLIMT
jgi:hypothetical protein